MKNLKIKKVLKVKKATKILSTSAILKTNPEELKTNISYLQADKKALSVASKNKIKIPFRNSSGYVKFIYLVNNNLLPLNKVVNFRELINKKAGRNFRKFALKTYGLKITSSDKEKSNRYLRGIISKSK